MFNICDLPEICCVLKRPPSGSGDSSMGASPSHDNMDAHLPSMYLFTIKYSNLTMSMSFAGVCHKKESKMGRMYGKGKGLSRSALPYKRSAPSWLKITPTEVCLIE